MTTKIKASDVAHATSVVAYITVIVTASANFHWEPVAVSVFATSQVILFLFNTNVFFPYPSLVVAYAIAIFQLRVLAIILPSVGLIFQLQQLKSRRWLVG